MVVYTSQDQVYSEPILREFTAETGIEVQAVYDSEAVKTVGLANRLIAEMGNPRCDVFWNNEELRTWQLARRGVFSTNEPWKTFGYRSRRIVVNTNLLDAAEGPPSFTATTNADWEGKIALAYPFFGTTATHFLALRQHWGEEVWREWCGALMENDPFVVDGNSVVVQLVGKGEVPAGMTDYDDVKAGQRQGFPIEALPISEDSLLIPNTVAIVKGAPHPENARKLVEYLSRPSTVARLVQIGAIEGASPKETGVQTLQPDYPAILDDIKEATEALAELITRK